MNKYYTYDYDLLNSIGLKDELKTVLEANHHPLGQFSTFKSLKLEDINNLRVMLFNAVEIDDSWLERILRFLEIRMFEIKRRLKLNYESYNQMVFFKDCVISFLLEIYYYNKDFRFLNVALKLMDIKFKSISKQSLYNDKLCNYLKINL
jgi:hypothetical protein